MTRVLLLFSLLMLSSLIAAAARADERPLVVALASGRQFRGTLDPKSSGEELVLKSGSESVTIRRPIRWERIVRATLAGVAIEVDELRRLAEAGSGGREPRDAGQGPASARLPLSLPGAEHLPEPLLERAEIAPARVTSIAFDARLANWDGDVETEGLWIDLVPLNGEGYLAHAGGTVQVELFASQRRDFSAAPLAGGDTLELVERWTRSVEPADFTTRGVRLKLPFGAVHPEFDQKWLAHYYGLVHVRFAAGGHGVFESSQDGLRIRPYAPLRDRLELQEGRRFLPTERTGRGVSTAANQQ